MRSLAIAVIAALIAVNPAAARMAGDSTRPAFRNWGHVPQYPLKPPHAGWRQTSAQPGWTHRGRHHFQRGFVMPRFFLSPTFYVGNWSGYGLAEPGFGRSWVRYYDDAVLVDAGGTVYDSVADVDWEDGRRGAYLDDGIYRYDDDVVTWGSGSHVARPYASAGAITTTTTTISYIEEEAAYVPPRKQWKPRPKRAAWRPKPKPRCVCK